MRVLMPGVAGAAQEVSCGGALRRKDGIAGCPGRPSCFLSFNYTSCELNSFCGYRAPLTARL